MSGSPRDPDLAAADIRSAGGHLKAKTTGFSYAAINHAAKKGPAEISRVPSERATAEEAAALIRPSGASFSRTAPSRENAMLRAEVDLLKQQVKDLTERLRQAQHDQETTAQKLTQASRRITHQNSGLAQDAATLAEAIGQGSGRAHTDAVAHLRQTVDAMLLQPAEVEAAALGCCWLARYWALAAKFALFPEVAAAQAAHWAALAPPEGAMQESASHLHRQLYKLRRKESSASAQTDDSVASASGAQTAEFSRPQWMDSPHGKFSLSMQVTAADLIEVEQGLRQIRELGVEGGVMAALAEQARSRKLWLQLPPAVPDGTGLLPTGLDDDEAEEIRFQAAALSFTWGRAAAQGLEPMLATDRCSWWHARMEARQPSLRDFQDMRRGFQELRLLGVEQQLWQARGQAAAHAAAANTQATAS